MLAALAVWLLLPAQDGTGRAQECGNPPSRTSSDYWDHLERCGCQGITPPSRASSDYARFVAICGAPTGESTALESKCDGNPPSRASPRYWDRLARCGCEGTTPPSRASSDYARFTAACGPPPGASTALDLKCEDPPSRASLRYWDHLERCGCEGIARPSQASNDYARFEAICGAERESTCGAPPSQASLGYWDYLKRCGCEGVFPPSTASNDYARFKTICGVASPID